MEKYGCTSNDLIYVNENGKQVWLQNPTAAMMLNEQAARIAALEAALRDLILEWEKSDDMKLRQRHIEKAKAALKGNEPA